MNDHVVIKIIMVVTMMMMKRSTCGQWVHPICVSFTNELTVNNEMRACNLNDLNPDRQTLVCMICKDKTGTSSCVQCHESGCLVSAHPSCAFISDFQMTLHEAPQYNHIEENQQQQNQQQQAHQHQQ